MTAIWWYRIACIALCLATLPMFIARDGARGGLRAWFSFTVNGLLIYAPTRAADVWLGDVAGWCVLLLACAAWFIGRTPLGHLNFLLLQWFGVRLARALVTDVSGATVTVLGEDEQSVDRLVAAGVAGGDRARSYWFVLRWVWPLTGWWSPYVRIGRRPPGARNWLVGESRPTAGKQ